MPLVEAIFWLTFFCLLYAWVGYPALLTIITFHCRSAKPLTKDEAQDWPHVTLLISAYNEEAMLRAKLNNSLALDYPPDRLEIIVVSDASTDRTDEIASAFAGKGIRLLRQPQRMGKTAALNLAVPLATGELVIFTDADALFIPSALQRLTRYFQDPKTGFVSGNTIYAHNTQAGTIEASNLYTRLEIFTKEHESLLGSCVGADGAIFAIRRNLFQPLAPTDINDFVIPLLVIAQGYNGKLAKRAVCIEEASDDDSHAYDRQVRITNRTLRAIFHYRQLLNPFRHPWFAFCLVSHKLMKFASPFFAVGLLASTIGLYGNGTLFVLFLTGQGVFYVLALLAALCPSIRRIRLLGMIFTFCLTNVAMLKGWATYLNGRTFITWMPGRA
jgi:cellulose synthase/poly-beta-1,6-N-acetylglucosamine synthase-like glycosyltransferase